MITGRARRGIIALPVFWGYESAAGHFIEFFVVAHHQFDECTGLQGNCLCEDKITAVGDSRGVGASGSVDCVESAGDTFGQVGDCGCRCVLTDNENGCTLQAGGCGVCVELVGIGGGSRAGNLDELAVGSFHQRDNVALVRGPYGCQEREFSVLLDSYAAVSVNATLQGDKATDLRVCDVGNLELLRVGDGYD